MTKPTYDELENKLGQAYQIIGWLLDECGLFHTDEGQDTLTYFSSDAYDDAFLPWPKDPERMLAGRED
ncbi:hypothetical protein C7441_104131 [Pseudaminobacter salicylatoxidans]|uniref:Uncharacterized protein n=1 Tax=Pseudaminobacter salicylatoxidans TaxID=93369 RepID=A0A316C6B9_PSESE|nr:hypothetical protein [Pseudaminobacter salicylatoxidans]PWJ84863.1 hypothetical protein C7441_104131 [Pseudaminobacter salicylatoxidans]